MMLADYKYSPDVGLTREQYRGLYSKYAKLMLFKKVRKKTVDYSLDYEYIQGKENGISNLLDKLPDKKQKGAEKLMCEDELINKINKTDLISDIERSCLINYLTTNKTAKSIGDDLGLKSRQVYFKINNAINKLKYTLLDSYIG